MLSSHPKGSVINNNYQTIPINTFITLLVLRINVATLFCKSNYKSEYKLFCNQKNIKGKCELKINYNNYIINSTCCCYFYLN